MKQSVTDHYDVNNKLLIGFWSTWLPALR